MRGVVVLGLALGVLMLVTGVLLTGQGLGYVGGAGARDALAVLGPVVAGFGLALVISIVGALRR